MTLEDQERAARRRVLQQLAGVAAGGFAAQTLAADQTESDPAAGLPPLLRPTPELLETVPTMYPIRNGEVGVVAPKFPYGHGLRYGIKVNGADTTAEVINWRDSIVGLGTRMDADGFHHLLCKGVLPAGVIRITKPRALLDLRAGAGPTLWGYVIEGEGSRLTTIVYDPDEAGPLMFSSNRIFELCVRNVYFQAPEGPKHTPDWFVSESVGQQQYCTFENLAFDGAWGMGVCLSAVPGDPHGGDCNSEFKFDRISLGGNAFSRAFLTDSPDDSLQSSQFVNYWFSNIKTTMHTGRLVLLHRGGHVNLTDIDVSGYMPKEELFVIDLPGTTGNDGAHSLIIRNARFEGLSPNSRFLRCRWERGTVVVDGYNDVVWRELSRLAFDIRLGNAISDGSFGRNGEGSFKAGAQYWFANGRFTGGHRFTYRASQEEGDDQVPATVQYQNCEFCGPPGSPGARSIHAFVKLVPDGGSSPALRPHLRFRACRVEAAPNHVTDWDLGIQGPHVSTTAPIKALKFGTTQRGCLPSGASTSISLPPGAMVLRVTWLLPGQKAPKPGRGYRFELSNGYESAPQRQLLGVFEGADLNVAANRSDLLGYETFLWPPPEGFDPVRSATLVLRETLDPGVHPSAQCIVEYV